MLMVKHSNHYERCWFASSIFFVHLFVPACVRACWVVGQDISWHSLRIIVYTHINWSRLKSIMPFPRNKVIKRQKVQDMTSRKNRTLLSQRKAKLGGWWQQLFHVCNVHLMNQQHLKKCCQLGGIDKKPHSCLHVRYAGVFSAIVWVIPSSFYTRRNDENSNRMASIFMAKVNTVALM